MTTRKPMHAALALALALAMAATPLAAAEHRDGPGRATFDQLDADGSGTVTAAEIEAHREDRFQRLDADGDGMISRSEFLAHAEDRAASRAGRMFDRMDADGDGALPHDLMAMRDGPRGTQMIDRLDTDGDGVLSEEEFEAGRERLAQRMREGHKGRKGAGGFFGHAN